MIDRLTGTVAHKDAEGLVLLTAGIGFRVEVPSLSLRELPGEGRQATIYTFLYVKEDALQLFGFASEEERAVFLLLLTVTKVGPKLALSLLSRYRPREVLRALAASDAALLSAVPGLGRKTAERMIVELRDKVVERWGSRDLTGAESTVASAGVWSAEPDTIVLARAALQELGLSALEADQALREVSAADTVESLVRQALLRRR